MQELNEYETYEELTQIKEVSIWYYSVKRIIDIIGSSLGIVLLSPVFLILAILIKLDSKGPVFYGHRRLGKGGKTIKVYKFRSMYSNSDELFKKFTPEQKKEFTINFKLKDDPRVTKMGKFLRKTSIDELPQLFNIFIGNMSIVGPRPIVEKEIERYGIYKDKFLSVKPGLTGLWQISGRSETTYDERVALDMKYIDNRTVWYDIKIFFKTFSAVLKKRGAY